MKPPQSKDCRRDLPREFQGNCIDERHFIDSWGDRATDGIVYGDGTPKDGYWLVKKLYGEWGTGNGNSTHYPLPTLPIYRLRRTAYPVGHTLRSPFPVPHSPFSFVLDASAGYGGKASGPGSLKSPKEINMKGTFTIYAAELAAPPPDVVPDLALTNHYGF